MPVSYKYLSIAQRNCSCDGFFKALKNVSQVQIFAYPQTSEHKDDRIQSNIYVVPWDNTIVVHESDELIAILDLTRALEMMTIKKQNSYSRRNRAISFNEKRTYKSF